MVRARVCAWTKDRAMITGTLSMKCSSMGIRTPATANTDMPANAAMPVNPMPMLRTSCETEMHISNMVVSELLCVRIATLFRNKYASILRVMS